MTAKEMFEELGYKRNESICYSANYILYEKSVENDTDIFMITFRDNKVLFTDAMYRAIWIDSDLLKAINKQCQELGWIE